MSNLFLQCLIKTKKQTKKKGGGEVGTKTTLHTKLDIPLL